MKNWLLILVIISALNVAAQETDYGPTNDSLYLGFHRDSIAMLEAPKLLIAPFHPDRYMSQFDHEIAKGTNYTYQHTRGFFRKGLDNAVVIAAKAHNDYVNLHADDPELNMDLDFLYKVTKNPIVPYVAPEIEDDKGFKKRLASYWVKLQSEMIEEPEPGTRVEKGQLVSHAETRELITKCKILNPILIDSLTPKYDVDYFVIVNELDMVSTSTDHRDYELDNYGRLIKVHFTVFDKEGNELYSLIKKRAFRSTENDLPTIIKSHYLPLGYEIIYSLDSYRFLQAGLSPIKEEEKKTMGLNLPDLPTLRKN